MSKYESLSDQSRIEILHISDLHFGTGEDAHNWHSQLAEDSQARAPCCKKLDGLIVSGDLTQRSTQAEYAAAVELLTVLSREFGLDPRRIAIVPGNHDVSWDVSKRAYDLGHRGAFEAAEEAERRRWQDDGTGPYVRNEGLYRKRFDRFSMELYEKVNGGPYPNNYPEQYAIHHWPEFDLLVVGFNSAWEIDHHYPARASIHPMAVSSALNALRANPEWEPCLKLAVWHHPLVSD